MKRAERHHLKENELAATVARVREVLTRHAHSLAIGGTIVAIALVAVAGYTYWRERSNQQAAALMAEAMTILQARVAPPAATPPDGTAPPAEAVTYPTEKAKREAALPKFMAAADAYPNAPMGIAARYHAGALLTALGRTAEAEQRYGEVIERGGQTIYAEMARMGRAEAQVMAGKHPEAIAAWEELSKKTSGDMPLDAVLFQLARTYKSASRLDDAQKTYQRLIDEFPQSSFGADARQQLDALKVASAASRVAAAVEKK